MADPFIGEIKMFAGNFAPVNWALCNGQLMAIADNTALFSLLGTTYGGDGVNTFGLPDLRGRVMLHQGQKPGLSNRVMGEAAGSETVTLISSQLPQHTHTARASSTAAGSVTSPAGAVWSANSNSGVPQFAASTATPRVPMAVSAVSTSSGGGGPHDNSVPCLALSFIICLFGIYPSRN